MTTPPARCRISATSLPLRVRVAENPAPPSLVSTRRILYPPWASAGSALAERVIPEAARSFSANWPPVGWPACCRRTSDSLKLLMAVVCAGLRVSRTHHDHEHQHLQRVRRLPRKAGPAHRRAGGLSRKVPACRFRRRVVRERTAGW